MTRCRTCTREILTHAVFCQVHGRHECAPCVFQHEAQTFGCRLEEQEHGVLPASQGQAKAPREGGQDG